MPANATLILLATHEINPETAIGNILVNSCMNKYIPQQRSNFGNNDKYYKMFRQAVTGSRL